MHLGNNVILAVAYYYFNTRKVRRHETMKHLSASIKNNRMKGGGRKKDREAEELGIYNRRLMFDIPYFIIILIFIFECLIAIDFAGDEPSVCRLLAPSALYARVLFNSSSFERPYTRHPSVRARRGGERVAGGWGWMGGEDKK
jgi:hypothetical protein